MPDPITPEQRLAEIRERHEAATDGPWWFDESDTCWRLHGVMGRIPPLRRDGSIPEQVMNKQILKAPKNGTPYAEYWPGEADAAFISHAWEDVRDLLAEVDQITSVARTQASMLNEITSTCMAVEAERDRLKARVAELTALLNDPDRLAEHLLELRVIYAESDAAAEIDRLADGGDA